MNDKTKLDLIVSKYRAQIGETVWHAFTGEEHIEPKSNRFYAGLEPILKEKFGDRSFRVLELAPSKNFIGALIAKNFNAEVTLMDMSKQALIDGKRIADARGLNKPIRRVAGDFHDLPFPSGYFDFVYMSGAVHHTKTPEVIFNEIARILKPGGFFNSLNEPCKREFSLYSYNVNRIGGGAGLTKFEQTLIDEGVLGIVSYPLDGGRPEDLFGMIENWSIPIDFFINRQKQYFNVEREEYKPEARSDFETKMLELASRNASSEEIEKFISNKVDEAYLKLQPLLGVKEKCMGFYLPGKQEVMQMAIKAIALLKEDRTSASFNYDRFLTNLFGGRISVLYGRNSTSCPDKVITQLIDDDHVPTVPMTYQDATLDIAKHLLPSIQDKTALDSVKEIFKESDWEIVPEEGGLIISCLNLGADATVSLDKTYANVVLCIRFYAIELEDTYFVQIYNGDNKLDEHEICRSETRCSILSRDHLAGNITFKMRDKNGLPLNLKGFLRVGVFQLLQIHCP